MSKAKSSKTKATIKKTNLTSPSREEMENVLQSYYYETPEQLLEKTSFLTKKHPHHSFGWEFTGLAYEMLEDLDNALYATKRAAHLTPMDAEIQTNLGNLLKKKDFLNEAEACYRKALKIKPNLVQAQNALGLLLEGEKKYEEAEKHFKKAIAIQSSYTSAYINLGMCLYSQGKNEEARTILNKGLEVSENKAEIYHSLGLIEQNTGNIELAKSFYQKAIVSNPDLSDTYCNLSALENYKGNYSDSKLYAEKSLSLSKKDEESYNNLGNALKGLGKIKMAEQVLEEGLKLNQRSSHLLNSLGNIYLQQGEVLKARDFFEKSFHSKPYNTEAYSNMLFCENYLPLEQRIFSPADYGDWLDEIITEEMKFSHSRKIDKNHLKIGFVSADLREHSVARFLVSFIKTLAKNNSIQLFSYSNSCIEDTVTEELKHSFKKWTTIFQKPDREAAQIIFDDQIDILIDLSGHTGGNRLPVFSYKPAPIQISWLGYFASTGLTQMDYLIADEIGLPRNHTSQFTEQILYLPESRYCFSMPEGTPEVSPLPSLTKKVFTFGCFQHLNKVNNEVLETWAQILKQVEDSHLRWQALQFSDENLLQITASRLDKLGLQGKYTLLPSVSRNQYFAAYNEVDVVLDTFPYTGGTTTIEALWMGVPTVTLEGKSLLERQGSSIIKTIGLDKFSTKSKKDYIELSIWLSKESKLLVDIRNNLRNLALKSTLFDTEKFTSRFVEKLFSIM